MKSARAACTSAWGRGKPWSQHRIDRILLAVDALPASTESLHARLYTPELTLDLQSLCILQVPGTSPAPDNSPGATS